MLGFRLQNPGPQAALYVEDGEMAGKVIRLSPPILSELVSRLWQAHENLRTEAELQAATPSKPKREDRKR